MKKLLSYLLAATVFFSLGSVMSCEKNDDSEDIRDKLNPIEVIDQDGTLEVNDWDLYLKEGHATLIATYRNDKGLYDPGKIRVTPGDYMQPKIDGDHALFEFTVPGSYTVSAGTLSIPIKVLE